MRVNSVVNRTEHEGIEILLVEDNPDDLRLALHAFHAQNISSPVLNNIHVARDGAEALDFLFCTGVHRRRNIENGPKMVLLDLKLPKVDGIEVLRRVKSDPRTRMIPIVVMSSSQQERDIIETYAQGANSYIVKPVDFDQFAEAVRQLGRYWLLLNRPPVPAT